MRTLICVALRLLSIGMPCLSQESLRWLVIEILKQRQSVNLNELTALIAKSKHLDTKLVKPKIQRVVNDLLKKGSIAVLNKNNALKSDYDEPIFSLNLGLFNEVLVG